MSKTTILCGAAAALLAGALSGCEETKAPTESKTTAAPAKTTQAAKASAKPTAEPSATEPASADGDITCKQVIEKTSGLMGETVDWDNAETKKHLEDCEKDAKAKPDAFKKCAKCNMDAKTARDTLKCDADCADLPSMSGG